jgi:glycosyltransferase involved in cell wall biosynthesis
MSHKFTFHFLGMPHTSTGPEWCHCAYSSKVWKALKMFSTRGHTCIDYSNEGAQLRPGVEHVDIFTEAERASYFGPHQKQKLYDIRWDANEPYWRKFNQRCVEAIKPRVKKGDFLLTLSGSCQVGPVGDHFPGSYHGICFGPMMVEWGIGYYGTQSIYRIFESQTHRSWVMGKAEHTTEDNAATSVPNFFDVDEFPDAPPATERTKPVIEAGPYFLFIGRIVDSKGYNIAQEIVRDIPGSRLVMAGQGDPGVLPERCSFFGHANVAERASLMSGAIAVLNPTRFQEPFGGTAVEAQMAGTPAITTDHGAFVETVEAHWRCASHREFIEAARKAMALSNLEREAIRARARRLYSLEAVAVQYERYFQRIFDWWRAGWYQTEAVDPETVR